MNKKRTLLAAVAAAGLAGSLQAQTLKEAKASLSARRQNIAAAAAFAAVGDLAKLQDSFNRGFDEGLSVNELKEVVLQLYAYTGFPRSLNAAEVLQKTLQERAAKGITDLEGPSPLEVPSGADKYELGKKNLEVLVAEELPSRPQTFIQASDTFLKEHLFADIFARGVLSFEDRETATVAALGALYNVNPQLRAHIGMALNAGLTPLEIKGIFGVLKDGLGRKYASNGLAVLKQTLAERQAQRVD